MAHDTIDVLDLSSSPPIHILAIHLRNEELHEYEDQIFAAGGPLTYNPAEARVFISRISQKKRAAFELRLNGVWTEECEISISTDLHRGQSPNGPAIKRRKVSREDSSSRSSSAAGESGSYDLPVSWPDLNSHVLVLRMDWLDDCINHQRLVSYKSHIIYTAKLIHKPLGEQSPPPIKDNITYIKASPTSVSSTQTKFPASKLSHNSRRQLGTSTVRGHDLKPAPPRLHRTTTSEHEALENSSRDVSPSKLKLPPLPKWAKGAHSMYACCRNTPLKTANAAFILELLKIKESRILTLDQIGVRAYSTSIASISAYPDSITHSVEIMRLPGCNDRLASLWQEWHDSAELDSERFIPEVRALEADPELTIIRLFHNIWGVGPDTARRFYLKNGWKELDDIVEFGWHTLSRVQQIGVKYYDEFDIPIPRAEVETIANVIKTHARTAAGIVELDFGTDNDVVLVVVGGYRRGKETSGDVDVILSHRKEDITRDLVIAIVRSLESEGYITHTLTLQTTTSDRDQATLPYRKNHGHGFDSLDKALCVWQDPEYAAVDQEGKKSKKNPNIHRRVDIILSPWRTVGCAVLGWSGGTTFQRDIRRFAMKQKGWKFDSSGVRDRGSGMVIDLEKPKSRYRENGTERLAWKWKDDWESRERRVMEGVGFGWRPASERCTG